MKRAHFFLQTLQLFVLVAESQSVSGTAKEAGLTQSAVTKHIQALEEVLGTNLFDRPGGRLSLTAAGKRYLRSVPRALRILEDAAIKVRTGAVEAAEMWLGIARAVVQR